MACKQFGKEIPKNNIITMFFGSSSYNFSELTAQRERERFRLATIDNNWV